MRERRPPTFNDASDLAVWRYLDGKSAHSDIAQPLWEAAHALAGTEFHCPDPANFSYALAHVAGKTFAFAESMRGIAVRLPPESALAARAEGAEPIAGLEAWRLLPLFDGAACGSRYAHWVACAHACACARGTGSP